MTEEYFKWENCILNFARLRPIVKLDKYSICDIFELQMACERNSFAIFADTEKIGILMMFLPHLILANHFNERGFVRVRKGATRKLSRVSSAVGVRDEKRFLQRIFPSSQFSPRSLKARKKFARFSDNQMKKYFLLLFESERE